MLGQMFPSQIRPAVDSDSCRRLGFRISSKQDRQAEGLRPAASMTIYLRSIGAELGASVTELAPEEFSWWLHQMGPVQLQTVTVAVHETAHHLENLLRICGNGSSRFRVGQQTYSTRLRLGQTPALVELSSRKSVRNLGLMSSLRLERYVYRAAPGNDLTILLGEAVAYLIDAETELAMYEQVLMGSKILPPGITSRNAGFSGLIDILVLLKVYLAELGERHLPTGEAILGDEGLICLVADVHAGAQRLVSSVVTSRMQEQLGFAFGLERTEAMQFAELLDIADSDRGVFREIAERAGKSVVCGN